MWRLSTHHPSPGSPSADFFQPLLAYTAVFFIRFCVLHGRGMTDNTFLLKPHTIALNLSPGSQRSWSLLGQGRVSGRSDCQISDPGWYSK